MTLSSQHYTDNMLWFYLDTISSQPERVSYTFRFIFMQAYTFLNEYI